MKCPRCPEVELQERARQNVTVDLCPQCRGVWLDRGELEKLMAQAESAAAEEEAYWSRRRSDDRDQADVPSRPPRGEPAPSYREPSGVHRDPHRDAHRDHQYGGRHADPRYRKKKHWLDTLGDIFD
jgi:uncharacterized protein